MKKDVKMIRRSRFVLAACLLVASFGTHAAAPAGRYTTSTDTVTDTVTGLVWQRCTAGLSGSNCAIGTASFYTQSDAASYCQSLNLGGWSTGWRLPNVKELQSIIDVREFNPSIDATAFPVTPSEAFWTSSSVIMYGTPYASLVGFRSGYNTSTYYYTANNYRVRCVR